ncbi:MAG TPA: polysaccharide biosynthesis protein, partial [Propionibacteriaceae bacterium]|nr:polysaccharide biosynthesis protein [Propionibacteriaceae bacterium]
MTSPFARRLTRVLWDWLSWALATMFVVGSRYDFELKRVLWANVALYTFTACLLQAVLGAVGMLYRGRYRIATFEESVGLATTTGLVGMGLALGFIGLGDGTTFPRAIAILTPPVALLVMAGGRVAFRAWRDRVAPNIDAEKVLIYGAGNAGYQLVRLLTQEPNSPFQVVGFIDDAKSKRNLRLLGVPVLGPHRRLLEMARKHSVTTVILSIPNASSALVRHVTDTVEQAGIRLLVVPPV